MIRLLPRFLSIISRVLCQARINKILSRVSRGNGNLRENPRSWQEFQDILHWADRAANLQCGNYTIVGVTYRILVLADITNQKEVARIALLSIFCLELASDCSIKNSYKFRSFCFSPRLSAPVTSFFGERSVSGLKPFAIRTENWANWLVFRRRKKNSTIYAIVSFFSPSISMKISNFSKTLHTIRTKFSTTVIIHPKGPLRAQWHQNRTAGMWET